MKRPKFFEDLDRSLAGEPEPEPVEVRVETISWHYQDMLAANAETERMAGYARLMQNAAPRISLGMCGSSLASSRMDHWPGSRGSGLDSALGGLMTALYGGRR